MIKSQDHWLSRQAPFGAGGWLKPQPCKAVFEALWSNRRRLAYAWAILTRGACDGCSLGSRGLRNSALGGLHFCPNRFRFLHWNTMGPLKASAVEDATRLRTLSADKLRSLGRLAHPMIRRKHDRGFSPITWDSALEIVRSAIRDAASHELGFCAASRAITNETYYVFQKLARALGTNNVDCHCRQAHAADISALRSTLGNGAASCSLADLMDTDLLIMLEPELTTVQPAAASYLHYARKRGTRIIVVQAVREPELLQSRPASSPVRPASGAQVADDFFTVRAGGEIPFINGVIKALIEWGRIDHEFITRHTRAFDTMANALRKQSWERLEHRSGAPRQAMERFARLYGYVSSAVFVYGAALTQREFGADNVKAVVNLALARGMVGRENCGILPIRDPGWLQGGSDCGAEPDHFPGGFPVNDENARRFSNLWRHPVSSAPGLPLARILEAAQRGRMKFLYLIGGEFLQGCEERERVAEAFSRVPVRIHQDIALDLLCLLEPAETVLALPGQTPYDQEGGGTTTSAERKIFFTPRIARRAIGESLPGWQIPALIGRRSMSNGDLLFPFTSAQTVREEMARVMPNYRGIEELRSQGDYFQWGGPQLFKGGNFRGMPDERALFSTLEPPGVADGEEPAHPATLHYSR